MPEEGKKLEHFVTMLTQERERLSKLPDVLVVHELLHMMYASFVDDVDRYYALAEQMVATIDDEDELDGDEEILAEIQDDLNEQEADPGGGGAGPPGTSPERFRRAQELPPGHGGLDQVGRTDPKSGVTVQIKWAEW